MKTTKIGQKPRTATPRSRPRVHFLEGEMVVGKGLGANQLVGFLDALNDMGKVFENPPRLDGKAFKFEPLALAA